MKRWTITVLLKGTNHDGEQTIVIEAESRITALRKIFVSYKNEHCLHELRKEVRDNLFSRIKEPTPHVPIYVEVIRVAEE